MLSLLFPISSVSAYEGIFKILDERYEDTALSLPESQNLTPDIRWQHSGNIRGWIDILGFKNTVKINNVSYIQDNPTDNAIVRYDVSIEKLRSRVVLDYRVNCYWCFVSSVDKTIDVQQEGNQTIAYLNVTLNWYEAVVNSGGIQIIRYAEHASFKDVEQSPEIYPTLSEPRVIITQYNNSLYENIGIKIFDDNYTKVSFKYKDMQAVRYFKILHVDNNTKGVVYGNLVDLEKWDIEGSDISRFGDEIIIDGNLSQMDISDFDIRSYDVFTSRKADQKNFTIERVEFAPQRFLNGVLIAVVGIVSVFVFSALYLFNRMVYKCDIRLF